MEPPHIVGYISPYFQVSTVTFGAAMAGEIRWHRALQLLREVREARGFGEMVG